MGVSGSVRLGDVGNLRAGPDTASSAYAFAADVAIELVIVGGGNMGAALLGGLLAADGADPAIARRHRGAARRGATSWPTQFPGVADRRPTCRRARPR